MISLLPAVLADKRFNILVVDDNSPDGTADLVSSFAASFPSRIAILRRPEKMGLGSAYRDGFRWALTRNYDYILEMDGDFSHDPQMLGRLLGHAQTADVVVGSRYVNGGNTESWSLARRAISQLGSTYARSILGVPYRDLTGGFKCFHRSVLESIDLDEMSSAGYVFQIEMTYRAHLAGFQIVEVPITFHPRRAGASKMNAGIVGEALVHVLKLRLADGGALFQERPTPQPRS